MDKVKFTVRLTNKEHAHLKKQADNAGLKMEPYIRRLIAGKEIREECEKLPSGGKNLLFAGLDDETAEYMEDVRLGRRKVQDSSED